MESLMYLLMGAGAGYLMFAVSFSVAFFVLGSGSDWRLVRSVGMGLIWPWSGMMFLGLAFIGGLMAVPGDGDPSRAAIRSFWMTLGLCWVVFITLLVVS